MGEVGRGALGPGYSTCVPSPRLNAGQTDKNDFDGNSTLSGITGYIHARVHEGCSSDDVSFVHPRVGLIEAGLRFGADLLGRPAADSD